MKRINKVLLVLAMVSLTFSSCTPDDQCGVVTDYGIDNRGNYTLDIDGTEHVVSSDTWWEFNIGDALCLEY